MPYLIQRRVRNRQPQQAVRVKSEFYGTRAWLPGLLEASRQSDGILPNNAISQLGVSGKLTHAVAERFQLDSSAGFIPTAGGYTLALHFVYGGALGSGQGVGPRVVGGSLSLRATPYLGSSGIVSWDYGGATEGVSRCSAALPTSDGTIAAYVFTTGPRGMEIWSNGNKAASNAANPTRSDTSAYIYAVGDMYGGDSGSESFALVASIPYQVSEDVAQALSANPWQIFEDEEDYIWVPDVGGGYTATGAVPGSGSIVTGAATKTQVYSGSGAVAGTGATVTGAATRSFDSTGTIAGTGAIVTGSATNTQPSITSTGAVAGQGAIVSGAATRQFSSTGTVAGQGATVTGAATKTQVYSSTGAVVGGGAVVAGTATNTPLGISAYGDVAGQGSIVSGVATRTFSSTGAVVGAVATVAGTATRAFTATGAIAGYTAVITGAATNTPLGINGYGSVSGQGASVSGTATVTAVFTATGAVVGSDATITGSATNVRVVTSSGAISGQGATVAGSATVSGITVWPLASDVRRGVSYGPTGNDYTGTLSVGTGSGGGMNVTLSEPRLSVVSRDNSVYVIHETQRKIFS